MAALQFTAILFSLFMIYFVSIHYRKGEINRVEVCSWILIWLTAIFIVIFPDLVRPFASTLLISRLFDFMVMGGFIMVISMTVKSYLTVRKMEKLIERMIREDAIRNVKKAYK